ncbi:DNA-directed RNA polymerase subunit F [Candidatus Micrarchaeota archaeon]|nr:MAG: DNA-directed RNA polymerase subunit F [Candidatus Micrarchaeota archaeon]
MYMIGKEIIGQKYIPLTEVKKILEKQEKEFGELTYEQKVTLDYAKEFGKSSSKKVKEAINELTAMGIDEKTAVKIVDVKPTNKEQVKLIFEKIRFDLKEPQIKKILEIVQKL